MTELELENQINTLWVKYNSIFLGYFVSRIGRYEDAQDLLAETFSKYYISQKGSTKIITNPKAFLWKIAGNLLKDYYKNKSSSRFKVLNNTINIEKVLSQSNTKEYDIATVISCIKATLTKDEFELLSKVYIDEIGYDKISTEIKPATLRRRFYRTVQKAITQCETKFREIFSS
jgi:DNA-directed RNA polymerase specialized sigma24 family protein